MNELEALKEKLQKLEEANLQLSYLLRELAYLMRGHHD